MITLHAMRNVDGDKLYAYDFCGLSTDEKPQTYGGRELEANSLFLELDTGDFYYLETPAQSGEEVLLPQTSFVGDYMSGSNCYEYSFDEDPFDNDNIYVKFDGIKYECPRSGDPGFNLYGALWDFTTRTFDWSAYPFALEADTADPEEHSIIVSVADGNEHTIEIYIESSIPAVWKKVGSGGSEPEPTYEKIYELTFSDWQDDGDGSYFTDINGSDAPSEMFPNTVTVDWDGVRYKDLEIVGGYQWGAPYDYELEAYDFSVYPFSFQLYDVSGGLELHLVANSDAEHTFEVYVEVDG